MHCNISNTFICPWPGIQSGSLGTSSVENPSDSEFNKKAFPAGHQVRNLQRPTTIRTLPVQMSDTLFCTVYLALQKVSFLSCQKYVDNAHWIKYIFVGESDCLKEQDKSSVLPLVYALRNKSRNWILIGYYFCRPIRISLNRLCAPKQQWELLKTAMTMASSWRWPIKDSLTAVPGQKRKCLDRGGDVPKKKNYQAQRKENVSISFGKWGGGGSNMMNTQGSWPVYEYYNKMYIYIYLFRQSTWYTLWCCTIKISYHIGFLHV